MPLVSLECQMTQVSDLSPLLGMPLERLTCFDTQVADLSPLAGAPLKHLEINTTPVTDLTPLAGMELETIGFTPKSITKGMEIVREMRSLKEVVPSQSPSPGVRYAPAEFWRRYDAGEFR
jgi:hypothetical protein